MSSQLSQEFLSSQFRACVPRLSGKYHKGQFGRIAVVGGSLEYSGAPHFAATAGARAGADVAYIVCCKSAATSIKSFNPESIVLPFLMTSEEAKESFGLKFGQELEHDQVAAAHREVCKNVDNWMKSFHSLVVGPGLGRDALVQACARDVIQKARQANIPVVIDGDGIVAIESSLETIKNYRRVILTPNAVEYIRLCKAVLGIEVDKNGLPKACENDEDRRKKDSSRHSEGGGSGGARCDGGDSKSEEEIISDTVKRLAKALGHVTILKKGSVDTISDGFLVVQCTESGGLRRWGGQGDILSGIAATFMGWNCGAISTYGLVEKVKEQEGHPKLASKSVLAAWGAATLTRSCARRAFSEYHRGGSLGMVLEQVGSSFYDLFEHQTSNISEFETPYSDEYV
ncbi:ATP-dependent (S)-NAD(P)H-hydrate dehydratase-like [Schistocerca gregaria]|uniref:ATP-dependent (S)-NAD(P)H-hydrate dehydratase-like n=1 Tax=Schistocerca gregaria TaxID=7010 RepID=UPI00211F1659|nr:ATP-dependent (S)-NAD(P)H-hydrate dehydratase-like [Schistocerca gregaria]